jgi:hypothetical protein
MTTKQIVAKLSERIYALVTTGDPIDVVVWRHPGETADEAIERYRRQTPNIVTMPSASTIFHVVSWEGWLVISPPCALVSAAEWRANHTVDATWLALAQQGKAGTSFCRASPVSLQHARVLYHVLG